MSKRHHISWVSGMAIAVVAVGLVWTLTQQDEGVSGPPCRAQIGDELFAFDADQAAHATTIAAVGKRDGMPNHAVTVALATALQESALYNIDFGDRDSLGLFQQRPSQGWGTETQIMSPNYAATTFYSRLRKLPRWESLPVTEAAQGVQRSAAPDAYAQWEPAARLMARAMTGEEPASFACRFDIDKTSVDTGALNQHMSAELGSVKLGSEMAPARGWLVASWLIGHAGEHGIRSVSFGGQRWTAKSGKWVPATSSASDKVVKIND